MKVSCRSFVHGYFFVVFVLFPSWHRFVNTSTIVCCVPTPGALIPVTPRTRSRAQQLLADTKEQLRALPTAHPQRYAILLQGLIKQVRPCVCVSVCEAVHVQLFEHSH